MLPVLKDLFQPVRSETWDERLRSTLTAKNYGVEWCLTDILRTPDKAVRQRVIDCLKGLDAASRFSPDKRYRGLFRMRKIGEVPITRPTCIGEPRIMSFDLNGRVQMQPHPQQIEYLPLELPDEWDCAIASDQPELDAVWLLKNHGWFAKDVGKDRRRWSQGGVNEFQNGKQVQTSLKAIDQWKVVEVAFERMHPELAPKGKPNGQEEEESKEVTNPVAAAPLGANPLPTKRRGRPPKSKPESVPQA